jgi:hypothetical protein
VVRQRILSPPCGGSNPPAPATLKFARSINEMAEVRVGNLALFVALTYDHG